MITLRLCLEICGLVGLFAFLIGLVLGDKIGTEATEIRWSEAIARKHDLE